MKNVIQILSIVLIIVLLIILIVRKYESFTTNTFISEEINKMGDTLIQPYKCKFISDVVVPNKIIPQQEANNINVVKIISNKKNKILYMTRSLAPSFFRQKKLFIKNI